MTNEDLNLLRSLFREEVGTSEQRLRRILREEMDAAIHASETRTLERMNAGFKHVDGGFNQIDERFNQMDERFNQMDERFHRIDVRLAQMDELIDQFGNLQREMQAEIAKVKVDQQHIILILDEATRVINAIQADQRALERKVEDNTGALRRDMQRLTEIVHEFAKQFIDMNAAIVDRLIMHERTSIDYTHHRPNSAA
ncbi:MAG TPA: hypothetical protein VFQ30_14725 [Ktedonobacteraceae bacterium]|nr:hypothetical protein [Ktedonobacteraceae bacterium]